MESLLPYRTWGTQLLTVVKDPHNVDKRAMSWLYYLVLSSDASQAACEQLSNLFIGYDIRVYWGELLALLLVNTSKTRNMAVAKAKQMLFQKISSAVQVMCQTSVVYSLQSQVQELLDAPQSTSTVDVVVENIMEQMKQNVCAELKGDASVMDELKTELLALCDTIYHLNTFRFTYRSVPLLQFDDLQKKFPHLDAEWIDKLRSPVNSPETLASSLAAAVNIPEDTALTQLQQTYMKFGSMVAPYKLLILFKEASSLDNKLAWDQAVQEYVRIAAVRPVLADLVLYGALNSFYSLQKECNEFLQVFSTVVNVMETAAPMVLHTLRACRWSSESELDFEVMERVIATNGDVFIGLLRDMMVTMSMEVIKQVAGEAPVLLDRITAQGSAQLGRVQGYLSRVHQFDTFESYKEYLLTVSDYDLGHLETWMMFKCAMEEVLIEEFFDWTRKNVVRHYKEDHPVTKEQVDDWLTVFKRIHPIVHVIHLDDEDPTADLTSQALTVLGYTSALYRKWEKQAYEREAQSTFSRLKRLDKWHNYLLDL